MGWPMPWPPRGRVPRTAEQNAAIIADIASFSRDPLGYVLYAFPWGVKGGPLERLTGPRQWQREVLEEIGARLRALPDADACSDAEVWDVVQKAVASGHGIGKSALFGMLVMWALSTMEDTRGIVTANTEKQLQTKTSPELAKWHRLAINADWFIYTATALYSADPKHEKTWRFDLVPWSEHNTEAFAGLHNEGKRLVLLFDEASAIADKVWEVAEGALTDARTEIIWLVFGNGTRATGRFRECFRKFRNRWSGTHIDSRTVEGTNKEQIAKVVEDNGGEDSDYVKIRVRGLFPSASPKQFISETDVDAARGRHLKPDQYQFAPVILTLDPAWSGDDPLVIGKRQGLKFEILLSMPKNDNDIWVANKLALLEDEHHADAVFIDGGYGTGIKSAGDTMGREWTLVWFAEKPNDEGYLNKRAEMWGDGKKWLKAGGAIPPDHDQLREDMIGPETKPRLDGKIQLESKEDMKHRGIPSPNYGDAWALSFAHPVVKRTLALANGQQRGIALWDYEPLTAND